MGFGLRFVWVCLVRLSLGFVCCGWFAVLWFCGFEFCGWFCGFVVSWVVGVASGFWVFWVVGWCLFVPGCWLLVFLRFLVLGCYNTILMLCWVAGLMVWTVGWLGMLDCGV